VHNFFLAFTPYHVLLSCAVALQECTNDYNHLVIRPSFSHAQVLTSLLSNWQGSPFTKISVIRGLHGVVNEGLRRLILKMNTVKLTKMVMKERVNKVYVGSDGSPESQGALYFAKSSNRESKGIYIEDGSAAYSAARFSERKAWKENVEKIFYGTWWEHINIHGTSKWTDEARLIYPRFARPELRTRVLKGIDRRKILCLRKAKWPAEYLSTMGLNQVTLRSIDGLLLLPRSTLVGGISNLVSIVDKFVYQASKHHLTIGIKCHPRDVAQEFLANWDNKHVQVLPSSVPVELLYLYGSDNLRFVVAGGSTSLLTARWLLSNAKIVCTLSFSKSLDNRLMGTFQKLGIKLSGSAEETFGLMI